MGANLDGEPAVIMSGASIQDNRIEVGVATRYYWADGNAGINLTHSNEDDYEALAWTADAAWNSNENSRTWSVSVSKSVDTIQPTKERIPVFIDRESLNTESIYFGVSQILNRTTIARLGLSYTYHDGFLSDPYKLRDKRPPSRNRTALMLGYRKFFIDPNGALQIDYRFYSDSWGANSTTITLGWSQDFTSQNINPYLRYYSQSGADFFYAIADLNAPFYADDSRLSSFGAITAGLSWRIELGDWVAEAQIERYLSDSDWALSNGGDAPGLVDFWRGTIGLTLRFD